MRIVYTGVQGTGKTTLVEEMSKLDEFKDYYISTSLARKLAKEGYKINQEGTPELQTTIMNIQSEIAEQENLLSDRCAIDCLCYTMYLVEHQSFIGSGDLLMTQAEEAERICKKYDFIFYITPEFPLVSDGERSDDQQFQEDMQIIFNDTISFFNMSVPDVKIIPISGTIEERLNQVMKTIHGENIL